LTARRNHPGKRGGDEGVNKQMALSRPASDAAPDNILSNAAALYLLDRSTAAMTGGWPHASFSSTTEARDTRAPDANGVPQKGSLGKRVMVKPFTRSAPSDSPIRNGTKPIFRT
jgi:hypothetical protein